MNIRLTLNFAIVLAGFLLLCSLSIWQVKRLVWKTEVLNQLEREYKKNASVHQITPYDIKDITEGELLVKRGVLQGKFLAGKTTYWPKFQNASYGLFILDPFQLEDGRIILVNRGWAEADMRTYTILNNIPAPPSEEPIKIKGAIRLLEHNYFTPQNNPSQNLWYRFDVKQLESALNARSLLPALMFAEKIGEGEHFLAKTEFQRPMPHNRHLQYALFWGVMALLWLIFFSGKLAIKV